jgi:preprotein translocase subunit YajC
MRFVSWLFTVSVFPAAAFAQQADKPPASGLFGSVLPMMVVMFLIIYFLMIRPEQKKQKQRQSMLNEMKKGDKVLTAGGIYGVIHSIKGDTMTLRIADNINVEVARSAISSVIPKEGASKEENAKESK